MKNRILILDNVEEEIQLFTQILRTAKYKVITANKESDLFDLIESEYPDLILISNNLVDKDIYLIGKKIKLLKLGENLPIIFINGKENYLDTEMVFNVGGVDYVNHPFGSSEIITKISNQIQIKILTEQLEEKTNQLNKLIPYYQKLKIALEKVQSQLNNLTNKDKDSSLFSDVQKFQKMVKTEWLRCSRQRSVSGDVADNNISLIMAQLNDFNSYESNHEPQLIKNCLKLVTETVSSMIKRPGDLITNLGKGKFAILLPNTNAEGAKAVAEKIQHNLDSLQIPHHYSDLTEYLSFTVGIANGIPTQGLPPDILIETAQISLDKALDAKVNNMIEIDYI